MPSCPLFDVNGLCDSSCTTCGTLCAAFPITDQGTLSLYKSKECTIISGDLYMQNIPVDVTRSILTSSLSTVKIIKGDLHFKDNEHLTSLVFLHNLVSVNNISLSNNPQLIDAKLASLQSMNGELSVEGCPWLCPARFTVISGGPAVDDSGCSNVALTYYFHVDGPVLNSNLAVLGGVVSRVVSGLIGNNVCT